MSVPPISVESVMEALIKMRDARTETCAPMPIHPVHFTTPENRRKLKQAISSGLKVINQSNGKAFTASMVDAYWEDNRPALLSRVQEYRDALLRFQKFKKEMFAD